MASGLNGFGVNQAKTSFLQGLDVPPHRNGQIFGSADENFTIHGSKFCYVPSVRAGLNGIQKANLIVTNRSRLRGPAFLHERKRLGHVGLAVFG